MEPTAVFPSRSPAAFVHGAQHLQFGFILNTEVELHTYLWFTRMGNQVMSHDPPSGDSKARIELCRAQGKKYSVIFLL